MLYVSACLRRSCNTYVETCIQAVSVLIYDNLKRHRCSMQSKLTPSLMSTPAAASLFVMLSVTSAPTLLEGQAAALNDCLSLVPLIIVVLLTQHSSSHTWEQMAARQSMCTAFTMATDFCCHKLQLHGLAFVPTPSEHWSETQMMPLHNYDTLHPQGNDWKPTNSYAIDVTSSPIGDSMST